MKHVILFVYLLLGSTGIAGMASLIFLNIRLKTSLQIPPGKRMVSDGAMVLRFLGLYILLFIGLTLTIIWFYTGNIIGFADSPRFGSPSTTGRLLRFLISFMSGLAMTAVYIVCIFVLRAIPSQDLGLKILGRAAIGFCGFTAGAVLLSTVFNTFGEIRPSALFTKILVLSGYPATTLSVLLMGITCLLYKYEGRHSSVRLLGKGTGLAAVSFLPLTVAEIILDRSGIQPYHPLSLDFLFYFELNITAILALYKSLTDKPRVTAHGQVSDRSAARFALTAREREMAALIAEGLANKEIAAQLGISSTTVRTHIYNLFQKAGARSRIELLNILTTEEKH